MIILLLLLPFFVNAKAYIFNPMDIDFNRLVPDEFAAIPLKKNGFNPDKSHIPTCVCEKRLGTPFVFWEPIMLAEIVSKPFTSILSGVKISNSRTWAFNGGQLDESHGFYYAHLYDFPALHFVEDKMPGFFKKYFPDRINGCLDPNKKFKVRYISELDLTQNLGPLALMYTPEIAALTLDGAIAGTTATCLADYTAVKMNNKPIDSLYFCSGDRNFMFPLSAHLSHNESPLENAVFILEKMIFKQHRISFFSGKKMGSCGKSAACGLQHSWTPRKSQYAWQLLYPKPKDKLTIDWGTKIDTDKLGFDGAEKDFLFLVWRKRYCCL